MQKDHSTEHQHQEPVERQSDEEIPEHFYDSDIASVNEKDFLSDNEPPKDVIQERKLLYKENLLHVFKTIVRVGHNIDKPARYDKISLRYRRVPEQSVVKRKTKKQLKEQIKENQQEERPQKLPDYYNSQYISQCQELSYNLGYENEEIEKFVTSMKKNEVAVFECEHLEVSKKSNIKILDKVDVFVIGVAGWVTVIDLDCDGVYMKEVLQRGEGHNRVSKHDEVGFEYFLKRENTLVKTQHFDSLKIEDQVIQEQLPKVVWKILHNLKNKQKVRLFLRNEVLRESEGQQYSLLATEHAQQTQWELQIEVFTLVSIDDVFLDSRLLKKTLVKGVSTARPESASIVYYALKFNQLQKAVVFEDKCFNSDWWEDFSKLEELGCRKNHLDDFSVSLMFKQVVKRMKPAEVAEVECRDNSMFSYGEDYEQYKQCHQLQLIPQTFSFIIRVYNFTEGKNCFNMELEEKIVQSHRKKAIAVKLLKENQLDQALKRFENIVAYYNSGKICQESYDEKVSGLMNCILCHMKKKDYLKMLPLCDQILENPKHGYDMNNFKINGPMYAKVEGNVPEGKGGDDREEASLIKQNRLIIDKCLYRKAFSLLNMGEGQKALESLALIQQPNEECQKLRKEAEKVKDSYEKKSAKMFKTMFG